MNLKVLQLLRIFPALVFSLILIFTCSAIHLYAQDQQLSAEKTVGYLLKKSGPDYETAIKYIEKNHPNDVAKKLTDILLNQGEASEKATALAALKLYPHASIKDLYINILEKTPSTAIKREIILMAAKFTDKSYVVPISKELENPFSTVREAAISTLREIGDDRMFPIIFKLSESKDAVFRMYALEALNQLYDIRLFNLVQNLLSDENKSVRILTLQCVEKNNLDKCIPQIRKMAQSDANNEVRIASIQTLGKMNDQGSLPILAKTLSAENPAIRLATAQTLAKFKFRQSLYYISEQLAVETDIQIKTILIDTLADMRDGGGFHGIEEMIDRESYLPLRIRAAYILSFIGGNRSLQILLRALKDKEYKVRAEAAASLASFRDRQVTQALLSIINEDSERYVRLAALYSLEKLRDRSSVVPLFDRYSIEKDPVFKLKLFEVTRILMQY
jgi:HEAT repeat protein